VRSTSSTIFCTYSDINYLPRLLTMVDSIRRHEAFSRIIVLCLDAETRIQSETLLGPYVSIIGIDELEREFPELVGARSNRKPIEYVFTLTPYLIQWVHKHSKEDELVVYLDADLAFFAPPKLVEEELGEGHVGIIPHGYPPHLRAKLGKYGKFNVGWVGIRNSEEGRECVDWWAKKCLEWCGDEPVEGKYADQGYLNRFPELFKGVNELENRGCNLAPWNTSDQVISQDSSGKVILGGGIPLVFFHFHGLKRMGKWMVTSQLNYLSPASRSLMELVYIPYLRSLRESELKIQKRSQIPKVEKLTRGRGVRRWARTVVNGMMMVASVITGNAVDMSKLK
jgi:hypothetical protein